MTAPAPRIAPDAATVPCERCGNPLDGRCARNGCHTFVRRDETTVILCEWCALDGDFCLVCGREDCTIPEEEHTS